MRAKCGLCKGTGLIQRDGQLTRTKKPYTIVCGNCNGSGLVTRRERHYGS